MVNNNNLNIVLVGYINRNLGDTVIVECAEYFIKEALHKAQIANYTIHNYNMYLEDREYIRNADVIVFAGGGLVKYKRENIYNYVSDIIEIANENEIPVFINCTGVEGYDENDERCQQLKTALNQSCVKGITVRDDYRTFIEHYVTREKQWLDFVLDSAAFSSLVYGVKRKYYTKKIGLGIAREGLFVDYGYLNVTKQFQLDFWKHVILRLEELGYNWEIFNNGLYSDQEFALEVLEYVGIKDKASYLLKRPVEGIELVKIISRYEGIIATRLHANIISYSVGCPSIGLVWNEKLAQWGENIGYPERFVTAESMEAADVVECLLRAMEEGCSQCDFEEQKNKILNPLIEFFQKYGKYERKTKSNKNDHMDWENILVATALGGKNSQFEGMNSPDTIMDKYHNGFRWFEADLKLTSDSKLVCANGWTNKLFRKLGEDVSSDGIIYKHFMNLKYYDGHYPTMDWDGLVQFMIQLHDMKLILDVRNNTGIQMNLIKEIIKKSLFENNSLQQRLILKVMKKEEIDIIRELDLEIMYEVPSVDEMEKMSIDQSEIEKLCQDRDVELLSVRRNLCTQQLIKEIKSYNKKICVFSSNRVSEVEKFVSYGVDMIGTDYLDVNALESLL